MTETFSTRDKTMEKRITTRSKWNRAVELQTFIDNPQHGNYPANLPTDKLEAFADAMEELNTLPNVRYPDMYQIVKEEATEEATDAPAKGETMSTYHRISAGIFFEVWHQEEHPDINPVGAWKDTVLDGWTCEDAYGHIWHMSAQEHDEAVVEGFEFPQQNVAQAR